MKVGERPIYGHRIVLINASERFRELLSRYGEVIPINDVTYNVFLVSDRKQQRGNGVQNTNSGSTPIRVHRRAARDGRSPFSPSPPPSLEDLRTAQSSRRSREDSVPEAGPCQLRRAVCLRSCECFLSSSLYDRIQRSSRKRSEKVVNRRIRLGPLNRGSRPQVRTPPSRKLRSPSS